MNNLQPIRLLPARERVASVLRKAILSREMPEGSIITLEGISSQLEVSNTPVREAFQILARDGLIKQRPNKGAEVLGISPKFIRDHYETRAILEREAAASVCRNGSDTTEIENAYYRAKEALETGDSTNYSNYNQAFHMAIWSAADNNKIRTLLSEMWNGLSMGHKVTEEQYARISIMEHEKILQAILARNESLAKELMNAHIIRSMENILTRFN
ncbi:GntR family transcriptional regulator [Oscillospiraceae bacterium PP1C4]